LLSRTNVQTYKLNYTRSERFKKRIQKHNRKNKQTYKLTPHLRTNLHTKNAHTIKQRLMETQTYKHTQKFTYAQKNASTPELKQTRTNTYMHKR